jgi:type IV pilus assembly protein PilN
MKMKLPLNLSSQPFRRDRPFFVASVLGCALLTALLISLVTLAIVDHRRSASARTATARLEESLRRTASQQSALDALLRKPENAEVLERSLFLNTLLYRKGVSWSKIFADLETVLPYNVRVITIRPQVVSERQVLLEMTVGSEAIEPVVEMLMRLEASEVFGATTLYTTVPPSQTEPLFRVRVSVNYGQKL